jgi:hypothetical protein
VCVGGNVRIVHVLDSRKKEEEEILTVQFQSGPCDLWILFHRRENIILSTLCRPLLFWRNKTKATANEMENITQSKHSHTHTHIEKEKGWNGQKNEWWKLKKKKNCTKITALTLFDIPVSNNNANFEIQFPGRQFFFFYIKSWRKFF